MKLKRVIPIITAAAVCTLGPAAAVASAATNPADVQQASSENWAGYVVGSGSSGDTSQSSSQTFKSVTGSWTQPTAKCDASTGQTYAAFWVGLGGSGSGQSLEQDGTEADCTANGTATYHAWYEEVPSAPVTVNLAVHPGDKMTATTTVDGNQVTESIVNHTTGQSFSKTLTVNNADTSSAEWIAEAPAQCGQSTSDCTPLPLTDFGKVNFTSASATDSSGHTGSISDSAWSAAAVTLDPGASSMGFQGVSLTDPSSSGGATPGSLSSDGSSFSVAYGAASSGEPTSTGTGSGGYPGGSGGYPGGSGDYPGTGGYGGSGDGYGGGSGYGYGYGGYPGGYGYGGNGYGYGGPGVPGYGYGYGDYPGTGYGYVGGGYA